MEFIISENEIYLVDEEGNKLAYVKFPSVDENTVMVTTTYVSDVLRGQGVAGKLMNALYDELNKTNKKVILKCSYAVSWFEKNTDKQNVIAK